MVVNGLGRCVDGELAGALPFYVNRHLVNLFLLSFNILLSGKVFADEGKWGIRIRGMKGKTRSFFFPNSCWIGPRFLLVVAHQEKNSNPVNGAIFFIVLEPDWLLFFLSDPSRSKPQGSSLARLIVDPNPNYSCLLWAICLTAAFHSKLRDAGTESFWRKALEELVIRRRKNHPKQNVTFPLL